jgi:hypothetical protein
MDFSLREPDSAARHFGGKWRGVRRPLGGHLPTA